MHLYVFLHWLFLNFAAEYNWPNWLYSKIYANWWDDNKMHMIHTIKSPGCPTNFFMKCNIFKNHQQSWHLHRVLRAADWRVTYFFTSRAVNSYRIDKPFEMGSYLDLIKRPMFLYDHQKFETRNFATLKTKFQLKTWGFVRIFQPHFGLHFLKISTFFTFPSI